MRHPHQGKRFDYEVMVPLSGESANQIFRDLEDWNRILAATSIKPPQP